MGRTLAGWRELPESFQGSTGERLRGGESLTTPKEKEAGGENWIRGLQALGWFRFDAKRWKDVVYHY